MDSNELIVLLAISHLGLYVAVFALTARPLVSVFHLFLVACVVAFGIRPLLSVSYGNYVVYEWRGDTGAYAAGLALQLAFSMLYCVGYLRTGLSTTASVLKLGVASDRTPRMIDHLQVFHKRALAADRRS